MVTLRMLLIGMADRDGGRGRDDDVCDLDAIGEDILVLLTSMLNPLPAIAILPLAILWFGLNPTALTFVIANAVMWPIAINVSMGFRTVNPTLLHGGPQPGTLLRLAHGPRRAGPGGTAAHDQRPKTGWAFGWRTIIAAELVFGVAGGAAGSGFFINDARYFLRIPDVFAGLVTIALIGIAPRSVFTWFERRTVDQVGDEERERD